MRKIPHPLMVVTAESSHGKKSGLLISSFNTVTLTPEPIVSFNMKLPSSTYEAISSSNHFQVSAICDHLHASKFAVGQMNQNHEASRNTDPSAQHRLFAFRCEWLREKSVEVGDHVIMVGRILEHISSHTEDQEGEALVYSEGRYRHVSPPLDDISPTKQTEELGDEELSTQTSRSSG